jgi:hypothetical protein
MASDVQLAAGPFSPSPLRFDVSDVARLRKRVGRASASLKFIALLLAIAILFGLDTYVGTTLALVTGVLVGWGVFYAAKRLRSGSTGAAIVAGALWLLWAGFNAFDAFPKSLRNGINGFSALGMVIFLAPLYFLALGLIEFMKHQRHASTATLESRTVGLNPWETRLPVNRRPYFVNRSSTAAYLFLVLSPLPWLFFVASAINSGAPTSSDRAELAGRYTARIVIHLAVWLWVARIYRHARRNAMLPGTDLERSDPRKPILYLRSFQEDNRSKLWARATDGRIFLERFVRITFEELVTDHLWGYAPVVAIGDPAGRNKLAPLGAARAYATNTEWQRIAIASMQRASIIVAIAGNTQGLIWEIETIVKLGFGQKLVLLFPPTRTDELRRRWQFLVRSINVLNLPAEIDLVHTRAVLWPDGNPVLISADGQNDWTYESVLDEAVWVLAAHQLNVPQRLLACPKCNTSQKRAGYPAWVIVVSVCLFPFGLLALLVGRKPTKCVQCGFTWQASLQVNVPQRFVSCPKCNTSQKRAGYPAWAIVASVCLFPLGLLALMVGRKSTKCIQCGFTWKA